MMSSIRCTLVLVALVAAAPAGARGADAPGKAGPQPHIDLHSHLSGAISGARLYRIGVKHDVPYPVRLLASLGIAVPAQVQQARGAEPTLSMRTLDRLLTRAQKRTLIDAMSAGATDFETFRKVYRLRDPLTKDIRLMPDILMGIGVEARRQGVPYLELSAGSMLARADHMPLLRTAVARVEQRTGVRLRFLLSFDRHAPAADNVKILRAARVAGLLNEGSPIIGIDVKGFETNSILDQRALLQEATAVRRAGLQRDFQIRVHAGETRHHSKNVALAVRLGATRIGHGLYGVTTKTMRLLRERGVIVEVNPTSNELLGFFPPAERHPLKKLLRGGVRVTVSTDGAGTFRTSPRAELAKLAGALDLTPAQQQSILRSNAAYLQQSDATPALQRGPRGWRPVAIAAGTRPLARAGNRATRGRSAHSSSYSAK